MTRHGKNATASAVYSHSERRKDAQQSGYGTLHARLGADSMKPFDCCSLTLQPCREPLISPDGFIFDKEAILNYILDQKEAYKRKLQLWEQQNRVNAEKAEARQRKKEEEQKEKFLFLESTPAHLRVPETPSPARAGVKRSYGEGSGEGSSLALVAVDPKRSNPGKKGKEEAESVSNMAGDRAKEWKSFWVPQLQATAEESQMEKPSSKILCPCTGKPLKFKDLLPVKFTPLRDDDESNGEHSRMVGKTHRYMCPITRDVLTNTSRCAYLRTSQSVVSMDCVEKLIRDDRVDPVNGKPIREGDIIELQRGGTGFAATNDVKAKLVRPQLELQ